MALRTVDETAAACPFGECDGSTWILDEESNETRPCRCRAQRQRRSASGGIGTGIGRRFLEVSFEREPIVSQDAMVLRQVRSFVRSVDDNVDAGRGLWFDGPVGTEVALPALLLVDGDDVVTDAAALASASVTVKVVEHTKGPKIRGFKYKNKSRSRKSWGHRQKYTTIEITGITRG